MKILLAAATEGEIAQTLAWLHEHMEESGENRFSLGRISVEACFTGVGIMAATESFTRALRAARYDFAVQAGVAGAFDQSIQLGEVVRVDNEALADLGAEDKDGSLLDVYALGLAGRDDAPFRDGKLAGTGLEHPLGKAFSNLRSASGLTVQMVSGTEKTIVARAARYGADVETMEGAPFHYCCLKAGIPFVQLRAISNYVEPRNKEAWRMREAVASLNGQLIRWLQTTVTGGAAPDELSL